MEVAFYTILFVSYFYAYNRWLNLTPAFFPFFFHSLIISALYIAGLINLLPEAVVCLGLIGGIFLMKVRIDLIRSIIGEPSILLFLCVSVLLRFIVDDFIFAYIDELSHWGLATKDLFRNHSILSRTSTRLCGE